MLGKELRGTLAEVGSVHETEDSSIMGKTFNNYILWSICKIGSCGEEYIEYLYRIYWTEKKANAVALQITNYECSLTRTIKKKQLYNSLAP